MNYKILIVDDNQNNLFTLNALLETLDVEVLKARTGKEALNILLSEPVDLMILDVQLPDINGFELLQMIKKKQSTRNIPIIMATAVFKAQVFAEQGFDAGAVDYMLKPFNKELLIGKIKSYMSYNQLEKFNEKILLCNEYLARKVDFLIMHDITDEKWSNAKINSTAKKILLDVGEDKLWEILDNFKFENNDNEKSYSIMTPTTNIVELTVKTFSKSGVVNGLLMAKSGETETIVD